MEDWVELRGFPAYMISNYGRVCNWKREIILRPRPSGWGYLQVVLWQDGKHHTKTVHRLVAEAFVPGWDEGLEVNHIDGNKQNNHETNLEWLTKGGNNQHAISTGLRNPRVVPVEIVETGEVFPSVKACAEHIGGLATGISAVLNGRFPHYKGLRFRYAS